MHNWTGARRYTFRTRGIFLQSRIIKSRLVKLSRHTKDSWRLARKAKTYKVGVYEDNLEGAQRNNGKTVDVNINSELIVLDLSSAAKFLLALFVFLVLRNCDLCASRITYISLIWPLQILFFPVYPDITNHLRNISLGVSPMMNSWNKIAIFFKNWRETFLVGTILIKGWKKVNYRLGVKFHSSWSPYFSEWQFWDFSSWDFSINFCWKKILERVYGVSFFSLEAAIILSISKYSGLMKLSQSLSKSLIMLNWNIEAIRRNEDIDVETEKRFSLENFRCELNLKQIKSMWFIQKEMSIDVLIWCLLSIWNFLILLSTPEGLYYFSLWWIWDSNGFLLFLFWTFKSYNKLYGTSILLITILYYPNKPFNFFLFSKILWDVLSQKK